MCNVHADGKRNRVFQAECRKICPITLVDDLTSHLCQSHSYLQVQGNRISGVGYFKGAGDAG